MRTRKLLLAVVLGGMTLAPLASHADVLNFDDLVGFGAVGTYDGVDFSLWTYYDTPQSPYNPSSGATRIFTTIEDVNQVETIFTFASPVVFNGAYFAGNNDVFFNLYDASNNLVATSSDLSISATPTFLSSGYSGSVQTIGVVGYRGYFVMDDVTFNASAVPEPGSIALLVGMGLSGAGFLARRKKASKAA